MHTRSKTAYWKKASGDIVACEFEKHSWLVVSSQQLCLVTQSEEDAHHIPGFVTWLTVIPRQAVGKESQKGVPEVVERPCDDNIEVNRNRNCQQDQCPANAYRSRHNCIEHICAVPDASGIIFQKAPLAERPEYWPIHCKQRGKRFSCADHLPSAYIQEVDRI